MALSSKIRNFKGFSRKTLSIIGAGFGVCSGYFAYNSWRGQAGDEREDDHQRAFKYGHLLPKSIRTDLENTLPWRGIVNAASMPVTQSPTSINSPPPKSSEMTRFSVPSMNTLVAFDDYVLHYDRRTRNASWVFEHLTRDRIKASEEANRESSKFFEDPSVHPHFRATNKDFKGSGYDRGHLAAAGNHKWGQKAMDQTFALTNICPQVGKGFNRHAWNNLERFTRKLTKFYPNVYVVTGPLYLPKQEEDGKLYVKYEVIGQNHVAVPTHFFKVIVMVANNGELELLSFVLPNKPLPEDADIRTYLVPLNSIERSAGLLFFESIPKEKFKRINSCNIKM